MASTPDMGFLPEWLDNETWQDFIDYRNKEIKKPFGEVAQKRMLRRLWALRGQGYDPNYLLEHAMSEGWQGIHPVFAPTKPAKVESIHGTREPNARKARAVERVLKANSDRFGGSEGG